MSPAKPLSELSAFERFMALATEAPPRQRSTVAASGADSDVTLGENACSSAVTVNPNSPRTPTEQTGANFLIRSINAGGDVISGITSLNIHDEGGVAVKKDTAGPYSIDVAKANASKGYSPSKEVSAKSTPKRDSIMKEKNWRSGSSATSTSGASDFGSPTKSKKCRVTVRTTLKDGQNTTSPSGSSSITQKLGPHAEGVDYEALIRSPPSCCVFVANLLSTLSDAALRVEVIKVFRQFGVISVKIRRDIRHMPFAFVQYDNSDSAIRATSEGMGMYIAGRPCRTEKAKAHRLYYFERHAGSLDVDEGKRILSHFGPIEFAYMVSPIDRTTFNLAEGGVMVQFIFYDDGKNALNYYHEHPEEYRMVDVNHLSKRMASKPSPAKHRDPVADDAYLQQYDIDIRSVFVNNLPSTISEQELRRFFGTYGQIIRLSMHQSNSKYNSEKFVFAFIEYETPQVAKMVIEAMNLREIGNKIIKVKQQDSDRKSRAYTHRLPAPVESPPVVSSQSTQLAQLNKPVSHAQLALGEQQENSTQQAFNGQNYINHQPADINQRGWEQYHLMQRNYSPYVSPVNAHQGPYNGQQVYPVQQTWPSQPSYTAQPVYAFPQMSATPQSHTHEQQYCGPLGLQQPYTPTSPTPQGPPTSGTVECPPYAEYQGPAPQGYLPAFYPPPPVWALTHTQQGPMFYWVGSAAPQTMEASNSPADATSPTVPPGQASPTAPPLSASQ
ncbi:hypothetical protein B7463_g1862, partial [Scytalidium lignicola]